MSLLRGGEKRLVNGKEGGKKQNIRYNGKQRRKPAMRHDRKEGQGKREFECRERGFER